MDIVDLDYEEEQSADPLLPTSSSLRRAPRLTVKSWIRSTGRSVARYFPGRPRIRRKTWCFHFSVFFGFLFFLLILLPFLLPTYARPPAHFSRLDKACRTSKPEDGCANPNNEKVFITVALYDPDGSIAGGKWGQSVLDLVHLIGKDNVYISIYENDSGDPGRNALDSFKSRLARQDRTDFVIDEHVPVDDYFPTITIPGGSQAVKRLAYLSDMRNRALRAVDFKDPENPIDEFDKMLFLNDAMFDPVEAAHLIFDTNAAETKDGKANYLAACAVDYNRVPIVQYDLYASRDAEGYAWGFFIFPYFSSAGKGISRKKTLAASDAVPVRSCWGGMVAVQAKWVQDSLTIGNAETVPFKKITNYTIDPDKPHNVTTPVRFRYEPEMFYDACECCLFLADLSAVAARDGEWAMGDGIFVNPYVRVSYKERAFKWLRIVRHWEWLLAIPQYLVNTFANLPKNNPHREVVEGQPFKEEIWNIKEERWDMVDRIGRNGMFCGVRETQLIEPGRREKEGLNWMSWEDGPWDSQQLYFPH
ncbi:unnamed protein product [Clonostachys chloroleuca]|uniref:Glycosyltransferase family 69 protein n=1 Tax=Clonostachys chloroleuca TaxID=1926264 RepID=A0AA35Q1H1_9HYPO|nr:unnamed protein product [Clonostachys chloroleuca]